MEISRQEDVKKLICLSFRDFIFDPKCLPTPQRSLIRHPRAIFFTPSSLQILKSIFSHRPDGTGTLEMRDQTGGSQGEAMEFMRQTGLVLSELFPKSTGPVRRTNSDAQIPGSIERKRQR
jgi:hypothetical protein